MSLLLGATTRPFRGWIGALACAAMVAGVSLPGIWTKAHAQSARIVALGASNTAGKGVGTSSAWPARLEAMLRARGINAEVINAGVNGDTTGGMLARVDSAVPSGTQIVVLAPGGNDRRRGLEGERAGNVARIKGRLAARKIRVIMLEFRASASERGPDGIHFTSQGHARIAASVLPQVLAAIRK